MAKNTVNYDQVDEAIREMQQISDNLLTAIGLGSSETNSLYERSNLIFLKTVNDINQQLHKCDNECVESIGDVYRAYKRYEEQHRELAEKL